MLLSKIVLGLLICAALPYALGIVPVVEFPRERIDVHLFPESVEVDGLYVYRNPWPVPVVQGMSIPLPIDGEHAEPVGLSAERLGAAPEPILVVHSLGVHRFRLAFDAGEEIRVRVRYRQHAPDGDARYILTTTQGWRRPLEAGIYRLHLHGVEAVESNYRVQDRSVGEGKQVLGFEREQFMPSDDWCLQWRRAK